MKLLTTGGLLYATVQMQAVNADGSSGTYQNFDWVAMFPEGANGGLAASSSATNAIGIGWDPVVVEVLANYDGGKTIAGFGKVTGTIYGSWVIKMWGSTGANNCGADSKITGYVTMVVGLNSELGNSPSANCSLTANAKVQWAWTNLAEDRFNTATNSYSYVITSATEEYHLGATVVGGAAGADAYIIVAGGTTLTEW
jgi:hypothetical protein